MTHLHRCSYANLAPEHCPAMIECNDRCIEDEVETVVYCDQHQKIFDACLEGMGEVPDGRSGIRLHYWRKE